MVAEKKLQQVFQEVRQEFQQNDGGKFSFVEVLSLTEKIIGIVQEPGVSGSESVIAVLNSIKSRIIETKSEINSLPSQGMDRIEEAGQELDAVVKATEEATNAIMMQAETLLATEATDIDTLKTEVEAAVTQIFEACAFQDITGQRIAKVCETLNYIDESVSSIISKVEPGQIAEDKPESDEERRRRLRLLHGPAAAGEGMDQSAVDALLADNAANGGSPDISNGSSDQAEEPEDEASQDDIDALFG